MSTSTLVISTSSSTTIGTSPLTVIFSPSGVEVTDSPIVKIVYDFDDNETVTVTRKLVTNTQESSGYIFQNDLGDPRNRPVTHTYCPSTSGAYRVYTPKVYVTKANTFTPTLYEFEIIVNKIDAFNDLGTGFFEDIHLLDVRTDINGKKILIFETVNPRYLTITTFTEPVTT